MSPVLTLTYNDTHSYVTCAASSLAAEATVATFERSTDQITWTPVRGGTAVAVVSNAASVNDYEFDPCVINYYRVSAIDTNAPTFVGSTAAVTANNASVSPTVPGSTKEGDLLVIWSAIRNSGTGATVCPTGWTVLLQTDNVGLFGKRAGASESTPTVAITGGTAGADVIAQMACFRNLELVPASTTLAQKNPSAANITYPGLYGWQPTWDVVLFLGWRQSSWTSVATIAGATAIAATSSTAGSGAGLVWDYEILSTPGPLTAGTFVVTGGSAAISYGAAVALRSADYLTRTVAHITPYMNAVWLKFPASPYLNRVVTLVDWSDNQRNTRMGTFAVHGQLDSVAFQDIASPNTRTMHLFTDTIAERQAIELVLSVGGVMLVHLPPAVPFDSLYASVGTYTYDRPAHRSVRTLMKVPLTEVAMPDLSIVGNISTYATLVNRYATYADVLANNASYAAVLALTGDPTDALITLNSS